MIFHQFGVALRRTTRYVRDTWGQSLVEFAVVLPLFLLIVMATVDFGWALRGYITATNSAREGARLGITGATDANIISRTVDTSDGVLTAGDVAVTGNTGKAGDQLTVSVNYAYHFITPLGALAKLVASGGCGGDLCISAATTMRIE